MDCSPPGSSVLHTGDFPSKNTRVGCHFILQGIFLTQGSNRGLLHCRQILYQLSHQESPTLHKTKSKEMARRMFCLFIRCQYQLIIKYLLCECTDQQTLVMWKYSKCWITLLNCTDCPEWTVFIVVAQSLSCIWLFETPWTVAHQASPPPRACSHSYPFSRWCLPAISSSVVPFSSCLQSFPASRSFQMSQLFASSGQSIGISASVLPVNIQGWFPLGLTSLISLQSK